MGEKGPELILFHGGERVLDAAETRSAISAMAVTTDMDTMGVGAPAIAGPYNAQLRVQIAVPIDIDGREVAKATAEYMGEEMSWI